MYFFSLFSVCSYILSYLIEAQTADDVDELIVTADKLQHARDVIQNRSAYVNGVGQPIPVNRQTEIDIIDELRLVVADMIDDRHNVANTTRELRDVVVRMYNSCQDFIWRFSTLGVLAGDESFA